MKPLVSVFIDGLKPEWVEDMPYVRSLGSPRGITTEFGYSISCHASMYTGASIQDHGLWFVWLRDEASTPFPSWVGKVPRIADNIPSRLALRKMLVNRITESDYPRGYFGIPRLVNVPMTSWPGLSVAEQRYWDEDDYRPPHPTIFELVRRGGLKHRVVGLRERGRIDAIYEAAAPVDPDVAWYYLFLGEVDHEAHLTAGEGPQFLQVLQRADSAIRHWCERVERTHGSFDFVLFSDHGHLRATKSVDLYKRLPRALLRETPHFVDANFARFWPVEGQEQKLMDLLNETIPEGWVLTDEELRQWECYFADQRYGSVIFYLDAPAKFAKTAWGFSRTQQSLHGYIPTNPDMNACLVSTFPSAEIGRLRDVFNLHRTHLRL